MSLYTLAALLATLAGTLVFVLALLVRPERRQALTMALDLWTAAGLFRLSHAPEWQTLGAVAVIVGVRHLVVLDLRRAARCAATT